MIVLKKGYQIASDDRQYILQQKRIVKPKKPTDEPKETIDTIGYYRTLYECLRALIRIEGYQLVGEKQMSLHEAVDNLRELQNEVRSWFGLEVER